MKRFSFVILILGLSRLLTCSGAPSIPLGPPLMLAANKADLLGSQHGHRRTIQGAPWFSRSLLGEDYQGPTASAER